MRFASTGPEPGGEHPLLGWALVALSVIGLAAVLGMGMIGCYPTPPVNPPNCAVDPTQEWCAPGPFQAAPTCDAVCKHVEVDLGCPAGSCGGICPKVQRPAWRSCVSAAASCADVDACDR